MKAEVTLKTSKPWSQIFQDEKLKRTLLDEILPDYIRARRWFAGKASSIKQLEFDFVLPVTIGRGISI